jgi:predicted RNA-binding Zn ribbon-like protein
MVVSMWETAAPHELGGRLCLGFVNSVEWRRGAAPVDRVADFLAVVGRPVPAPPVLRRAIALREALYPLLSAVCAGAAPDPSDVDVLERAFRAGSRHLALGADLRLTWTGADRLAWDVAADAVALLDGPDRARLKQCPGETCGWLFLDGSRNASRQWCDSRMCGNRARARRHYHRHRADGS